jgi:hypothetical protein
MAAGVEFGDLNWLAIAIAVVVNMILGFLWYSPKMPTGKIWMRDMKIPADAKPTPGQMAKGLILMIVGSFLVMFVFAHTVVAYNDSYRLDCTGEGEPAGCDGPGEWDLTIMDGLMGGFFTWIGFFVPLLWSAQAWEGKPWSLFFVNAAYYLVTLLIAGTLLVVV